MSTVYFKTKFAHFPVTKTMLIGLCLIGTPVSTWLILKNDLSPLLLAVFPVGLLFLARPIISVYSLLLVLPLENLFVLEGAVTWVRLWGILVFALWMLTKVGRREPFAAVLLANILKPALLFIGLALTSVLWAERADQTLKFVPPMLRMLALTLIVIDVLDSRQRVDWAIQMLALSGLVVSGLVLSQYFGSEFLVGAGRSSSVGTTRILRAGNDITGGPNETANIIVILWTLNFYVWQRAKSRIWNLISLLFIILGPVAVALTFSRTSYLIMPLIGGLIFISSGGFKSQANKWLKFISVILIVIGLLIGLTPLEEIRYRASTTIPNIMPFFNNGKIYRGDFTSGDVDGSRAYHWRVALAIFADHPLLGVGFGNYGYEYLAYQFTVSGAPYIKHSFQSPHSSHLALLAELGLAGFMVWVWLLLITYRNVVSCSLLMPYREKRLLSRLMLYAFGGYLLYGMTDVIYYHKLFWLFLGLSEVVRRLEQNQLVLGRGSDVK